MATKDHKPQKYLPQELESHWQKIWRNEAIYQPSMDTAKRPFYNLMMFPYPSAEGLHVGNMYAQTGADVYGRFKRMQGYDVFEPIGLDGFGIHSENYALKVGRHPMVQAQLSEWNFYRQMHAIGTSVDWSRTVETWDPEYYKWTQWIFTKLFTAGLAYRKKAPVNFCPSCKTVLSDEQVEQGACERCGTLVEKRDVEQWFFKITNYADRLLHNLDSLQWTEKVKIAQKNWIGKSEGALLGFYVSQLDREINVFTTRPDTLHGATFIVISPEHLLINDFLTRNELWASEELKAYVQKVKETSEQERREAGNEKTGIFTGLYAEHPITKAKLPIWVADYVLMGYGTGAIMAVPAHDERDFEFAKTYNLPITQVIQPLESKLNVENACYTGEGVLINSGEWNGWMMPKEIGKVLTWLAEHQIGQRQVNYHLRDWLISRQRYWGPPIPMIYCASCAAEGKSWFSKEGKELPDWNARGWYPVETDQLPVKLPEVPDWKPLGTGRSPLDHYPEFYTVACPGCGKEARRETDVSDTFLDSAWYFFRYTSTERDDVAFDPERVRTWLPVDMYIGGAEHSVLHLLYARFIPMVLHDLGLIDFDEPFPRFYAHGLIVKDGAKMSKSKGNVVVPDAYIKKYGADSLRTYLMFMGPFSEGGDFQDAGMEGIFRFMKRVWTLFTSQPIVSTNPSAAARSYMHKAIKGVTEDMESLRYNTAIAKLMSYYNYFTQEEPLTEEAAGIFLQLLAPLAPHMTEELWQRYIVKGSEKGIFHSIHTSAWPKADESLIMAGKTVIAVQVNGKLRDTLAIEGENPSQAQIEQLAKESDKVSKYLSGTNIRKVIYVPGKILNFVVG